LIFFSSPPPLFFTERQLLLCTAPYPTVSFFRRVRHDFSGWFVPSKKRRDSRPFGGRFPLSAHFLPPLMMSGFFRLGPLLFLTFIEPPSAVYKWIHLNITVVKTVFLPPSISPLLFPPPPLLGPPAENRSRFLFVLSNVQVVPLTK